MQYNVPQILAQKPVLEDLGPIPNPAEFSSTCPVLRDKKRGINTDWLDISHPDLSQIPEQFHPAIFMAVAAHRQNFQNASRFVAHINQGTLKPDTNFRVT